MNLTNWKIRRLERELARENDILADGPPDEHMAGGGTVREIRFARLFGGLSLGLPCWIDPYLAFAGLFGFSMFCAGADMWVQISERSKNSESPPKEHDEKPTTFNHAIVLESIANIAFGAAAITLLAHKSSFQGFIYVIIVVGIATFGWFYSIVGWAARTPYTQLLQAHEDRKKRVLELKGQLAVLRMEPNPQEGELTLAGEDEETGKLSLSTEGGELSQV